MVRTDQSDLIYRTEVAKFAAVVDDIAEKHEKGQPILVGTTSVEKSEYLSQQLNKRGVQHEVLNAKQHDREATIVAQAGRKGAVTVATNMAGRGTDIKLGGNPDDLAEAELRQRGLDPVEHVEEWAAALPAALEKAEQAVKAEFEEVKELGGLYVLGTERHESRRIDNQLRGRSGRQGDPGESRFYLSLGDDLMRLFKAQMVERVMSMANVPDDVPIENKMVTRAIASAQSQVEQQNFETRKNVLKYDEVLNRQREVIYGERRRVLEGEDLHEQVRHFMDDTIDAYIQAETVEGFAEEWDLDRLWGAFKQLYPVKVTVEELEEAAGDRAGHHRRVHRRVHQGRHPRAVRRARGAARLARSCVSWSGVSCCPCWTASGASTSTRWTTSRRASACAPWRRRTRWSSTSARASTCSHAMMDGHQGGVRRLPVQPGGPGRAAGRGGPGGGRAARGEGFAAEGAAGGGARGRRGRRRSAPRAWTPRSAPTGCTSPRRPPTAASSRAS